jgi:peptidoglycan/LPS O-acetylase OafA/YrhL
MTRKKSPARQAAAAASGDIANEPANAAFAWPALTGLRGLAALAVVCVHAMTLSGSPDSLPQPFAYLFAMGWSGVDVFFVLSAFLLTLPFLQARQSGSAPPGWRRYGLRRAARILPAYYVQIAILLLLAAAGADSAAAWHDASMGSVLAHLVLWLDAVPRIPAHVPPWWTLPVEGGFYLLLPLFATLLRPGRWRWLLLAIAASLAYRFVVMHAGFDRAQQVAWADHLPGRLHEFLVGMLAAYAFVAWRTRAALPTPTRADAVGALAIASFVALPALGLLTLGHAYQGAPTTDPLLLCWHLLASLVVAVLILALVSGARWLGATLSTAPLRALGTISYSLYLWHYPVMLALREALGGFNAVRGDFVSFFVISLVFSLVVATASWWLVERPAQAWAARAA